MYSNKKQMREKVGGFLPMLAPMMGMMGNPMEMMGKMFGRGVVHPNYQYRGSGVVHPNYQYRGSGVVHPNYQYRGSGMSGGMDAATFFNPMTSPLSPLSWAKKMFGGGQVGGGMVGGKRRGSSVRGQKIAHLMKTRGMSLGEASAYLKNNGQ
jgi:hypothetical protein